MDEFMTGSQGDVYLHWGASKSMALKEKNKKVFWDFSLLPLEEEKPMGLARLPFTSIIGTHLRDTLAQWEGHWIYRWKTQICHLAVMPLTCCAAVHRPLQILGLSCFICKMQKLALMDVKIQLCCSINPWFWRKWKKDKGKEKNNLPLLFHWWNRVMDEWMMFSMYSFVQ